jgi:hypothetical protein
MIRDYSVQFALVFAASAVMYFIPQYAYETAIVSKYGHNDGVWASGFTIYTIMVITHYF